MRIAVVPYGENRQIYDCRNWQSLFDSEGILVKEVKGFSRSLFDDLSDCDGFIWHVSPGEKDHASRVIHLVENYADIPVFPSSRTLAHYQDKIFQYYLFSILGINTPDTQIGFSERDSARLVENAHFPIVFKLITGSQSENVRLIGDRRSANRMIRRMFNEGMVRADRDGAKLKNLLYKLYAIAKGRIDEWQKGYFYFQEFLDGNAFDTRVTMIGNRAFASRRFNREGDFRASGSAKIDCNPESIDPLIIEKSFEIHEKIGAQAVAFDFLYKGEEPVLVELSFRFGPLSVKNCAGYWRRDTTKVSGSITWVDGQVNPGRAILEDFIEEVRRARGGA